MYNTRDIMMEHKELIEKHLGVGTPDWIKKNVQNLIDDLKEQGFEPNVEIDINYEYEMYFNSEPHEFLQIQGWYPIATDRIKNPENIEKYIKNGILRKRT